MAEKITAQLNTEGSLDAKLTSGVSINAGLSVATEQSVPSYTGSYTVTPSRETQVLQTNGLKATSNITIEPIPSNYGLITWDGSTLTVS